MTLYKVSLNISPDFDIEVEAENKDSAINKAMDDFRQLILAYVDLFPDIAKVEEVKK